MDNLVKPVEALQKFLDDNNFVLQLTPLIARHLQDGAVLIEHPSIIVTLKPPKIESNGHSSEPTQKIPETPKEELSVTNKVEENKAEEKKDNG